MTVYDKHNLQFMYPENWELQEQVAEESGSPIEVSLESPAGCLWVMIAFSPNLGPDDVLQEVIQGLQQQYEDFEFTAQPQTEMAGHPVIGGDADFYCLDFLVTALIQVIQTPDYVFCILSQAESRDFDQMKPVFQAITISLVQSDLPSSV